MRSTAPPRLPRSGSALAGAALLALSLACHRAPLGQPGGDEGEGQPDDLRALLEDGELTLPRQGALETPPPKEPPPAAADAGAPPVGGMGGAGTGGAGGGTATDARPAPDLAPPPMGGSGGAPTCPSPGTGGFGGGNDGGVKPPPPVALDAPVAGPDAAPAGGRGGGPVGGIGGGAGTAGVGGMGGIAGGGGAGGGPVACILPPTGFWEMDDCNSFRSELRDSSFNNFTAFRTLGVTCTEGRDGLGVSLPRRDDLVYVPDQPAFTFQNGVTVAVWVKPSELGGTRTILRKRDGDTSALALMLVGKQFTFVINRQQGAPAAVSARARAGAWVHVAATYDGQVLRLYLDGKEAATTRARGQIEAGEGPLLIGNDAYHRRLLGSIDGVWFATAAASPETITRMQCVRRPFNFVGVPQTSPPLPPGSPFSFELQLTNNNSPECPASGFQVVQENFQRDFQVSPQFTFVTAPSGQTLRIPGVIISNEAVEEGTFPFSFAAFEQSQGGPSSRLSTTVTFVAAPPSGCHVSTRKSLMIRDVSVVDDPVRTGFGAPADDPRRGVWTFKHLLEQIAATPADAADMAEDLFGSMTREQVINGFAVAGRPGVQPLVLDGWPRKDGKLDLEAAPLRLLAIVNRIDVRLLGQGNAGEGRFVFGVLDRFGFQLEATVILEYFLPATTEADVLAWAKAWQDLGALPVPSEAYNTALQALAARFAGRGVMPGRPNGSALAQLRTNEIAFGGGAEWELREFTLDAAGKLRPDTIKLTPHRPTFDRTPTLAEFINENEAAILQERHDVPLEFRGQRFLSGAVFNPLDSWSAPGIRNPEARHKFALNTCNGCHSSQETNTGFLMITPRGPGQEAGLSPFLTGTVTFDPVTGPRTLNDLARRNRDMHFLVCPGEPPPPPPMPMPMPPLPNTPPGMRPDGGVAPGGNAGGPTMAPPPEADPPRSIAVGIGRVH
jgi:hypothetical protein